MFTGLIEEKAKVLSVSQEGSNFHFQIEASVVLEDAKLGDSIAVDGVCLTVTKIEGKTFFVTAIQETLNLTSLKNFKEGTLVNLERCLRLSDRLGGHMVAGHVDGIGIIKEIKEYDGSKEFFIEVPLELTKYIIYKGSIAISGISLTVASKEKNIISVAIIPKTLEVTTLGGLAVGDLVNIEVDQTAKYIENFIAK